jgi:hypothetical protein
MVLSFDERDQRQPEIAHFAKQAVQRGLIHYRATEHRDAVALLYEGEPVEPVGPTRFEMPFEANLVVLSTSFVRLHASKVRSDVVSTPHHMW